MPTLLVVDDSIVDRRFVGGLLQRNHEYAVEFAEDGDAALARIRQSPPDLIVTDLQMPNRGGLDLVTAVRLHHAGIPVILMTGQGSEDMAVMALESGAAGYVPKSLLSERLLDTVEEALASAKADRTYERLIACMSRCEFDFELTNEPALIDPLCDLVQQRVSGMRLTDATGRLRIGTAVKEALLNAIYRGNLELDFQQLPEVREELIDRMAIDLILARRAQPRYRDRRVTVAVRIDTREAKIVVGDMGEGFAHANLVAPASLDSRAGRGLVLMRAFMDEVIFNDVGNQITLIKRRE